MNTSPDTGQRPTETKGNRRNTKENTRNLKPWADLGGSCLSSTTVKCEINKQPLPTDPEIVYCVCPNGRSPPQKPPEKVGDLSGGFWNGEAAWNQQFQGPGGDGVS